jgi:glyoxylase-like metal-dependent hydrolase (beta-lactamase superfamily II)
VLWDCISLIDDDTVAAVREQGGIGAITISHPHYYSSMVEWSRTFDAPIYLHAADREWVMRPDESIQFWEGETHALGEGLTLVRGGGHFPGGTMLHWAEGADGRGALLSGDIITVVMDVRWVSFMYSYPNLIPLPADEVQRVADSIAPYEFERIYGAWWDRVVPSDGKQAVSRSAQRYIDVIEGRGNRSFR